MRHMEIAWSQLGVTETPGAAATPEIVQYFIDVGRPDIVSDEVAWCAGFGGAVLSRAGVSLAAIPKSERLLAVAYLRIGTALAELRVGALAVLKRHDPKNPNAHHVGFVVGWTATHVTLLGGNQANAVNCAAFPRNQIVGLRWPAEERTAADLAAAGVKTIQVADRQQADANKAAAATVSQPVLPGPPRKLGLGEALDGLGAVKGAATQVEAFVLFAWGKWPWIAGAFAGYWLARMAWDAGWIKDFRTKAANAGASPAREPVRREADDGAVA